jgi:CRISPR-associated endonuclease Cas3-HD
MCTIENKPLAFYEVDKSGKIYQEELIPHLLCTAKLATELFTDRIESLAKTTSEIDVWSALKISTYLHDIGKASDYYYQKFRPKENILQFTGHHVISGLLVYGAAMLNKFPSKIKNTLKISSKIIASHHMAIVTKAQGISRDQFLKVKQIILALNEKWIEEIIDVGVKGELLSRDIGEAVMGVVRTTRRDNAKGLLNFYSAFQALGRDESIDWKKIHRVLTGILIVSDNIVASSKRGKPTLFVKLLSRELKLDLNYVEKRCEELTQR